MKLLGYILNGQTIGTDLLSWNDADLDGNQAILVIEDNDEIPSQYEDISAIVTWGNFGDFKEQLDFIQVREEIKKLLTPAQLSGDTLGLVANEIQTIIDYKLDNYYKEYDFVSEPSYDLNVQKAPFDYDYNILTLQKKRYFNKGELYKTEYYGEYNFATDTYNNLVLTENRTFYRINEMVYKRIMDIYWYLNTGVSGATKQTEKYYTQSESLAVGDRRRRNCITNLKIDSIGLIMMASGVTQQQAEEIGWLFLQEFNDEINVYIEGVESPLMTALMTTTNHGWLDFEIPNTGGITVRMYLADGINIDYTENNTYI